MDDVTRAKDHQDSRCHSCLVTDDDILQAIAERVRTGRPNDLPSRPRQSCRTPAPLSAVTHAEDLLGHPLPSLLRRLYLEVADGGFGPHPGIYAVTPAPGPTRAGSAALPELLEESSDVLTGDGIPEAPQIPPRGVVFLCDHGCAGWVLLDCRDPHGQIWWWDEGNRWVLDLTLNQWLSGWLDGSIDDVRGRDGLIIPGHPGEWVHPDY